VAVGYVTDVTEELAASIFTVEISIVFQYIKTDQGKGKDKQNVPLTMKVAY
jgi:hypothetical protein